MLPVHPAHSSDFPNSSQTEMTTMHSNFGTRKKIPAGLAALVLCGAAQTASAYAEDVCYLPNGGGIENCTPLPDSCKPAGTVNPICRAAAVQVFAAQGASFPDGGRSTFHVDATYLLAQAVGFSATNAYWIAAYDEATDLGSFQARDLSGVLVPGDWATATLDGLERTNFDSGGVLFHFHAPRNGGLNQPSTTVNGLHPDVDDADEEVFLANLRTWALAASSVPQCTAGLTVPNTTTGDYATGNACFVLPAGGAGLVQGTISTLGTLAQSFNLATGLQTVVTNAQPGGPLTSESFDTVVGGGERALDARLGVYLHALGDRVSHHVCTDRSVLTGPDASGTFTEYMDNSDCVQPLHALRHMWEVGVDFSQLAAKDRTTEAGLAAIYDELVVFASARSTMDPLATNAAYRQDILNQVSAALSIEDAEARVLGLARIACDKGLEPLPGMPACASL